MDKQDKLGGKSYGYYTSKTPEKTDRAIPRALFRRETGHYRKQYSVPNEFQVAAEDKLVHKEYEGMQCQLPGVATRSTFLMVFSPDGKHVASTHGNHNIYVSDLTTGKNVNTLVGHPRTPWCIAFHPSSDQILASGCLGGQVRVWDLHGGSEIWVTTSQTVIASIVFHPIERLLVIATYNELYFWDWSQGEPYAKCFTGNEKEKVRYVSFDPLGSKLITGISNAPIVISQWDRVSSTTQPRQQPAQVGSGAGAPVAAGAPDQRMTVCYRSLVEQYENLVQRYFQLTRARAAPTMDRGTDPMEVDATMQAQSSASRTRGLAGAFLRNRTSSCTRRGLPRSAYLEPVNPPVRTSNPNSDQNLVRTYELGMNPVALQLSRASETLDTPSTSQSASTLMAANVLAGMSSSSSSSATDAQTSSQASSSVTAEDEARYERITRLLNLPSTSASDELPMSLEMMDNTVPPSGDMSIEANRRIPTDPTRRFFTSRWSAFQARTPRAESESPVRNILDIVPNDSYWDRTVRSSLTEPPPPPPPAYPRPDPGSESGLRYGVQLLTRHIDNMQRLCRARLEILQLQQIRRMWEDLQTQIHSLHTAVNVPRSEETPEERQERELREQRLEPTLTYALGSEPLLSITRRSRVMRHGEGLEGSSSSSTIEWPPQAEPPPPPVSPRASTSCRLARYLHFRSQMSLRRSRLEAFRQPLTAASTLRGASARRHLAGRRHDTRRRPIWTASESLRSMISRLEELVRQQRVQRELARRGRHSTLWRNSAGELTDPLERPAGRSVAEDRLTTALANEEAESNRLYQQVATAQGTGRESRQEAWQRTRESTRVRARQVLALMVESLTQFFEENGINSSTPRGVLDDQIYNLFILLQLALELTDLLLAQLASTRLELENQWVNRLRSPRQGEQAAASTSTDSFSYGSGMREERESTATPSASLDVASQLRVPLVRVNDILVVDTAALNQPRASPRSPPHPRFIPDQIRTSAPTFPAENMAMPDIPVMPNHRIQAWDFSAMLIPDITSVDKNIVAAECKIHNDASVDVSQDGHLLVTLLPSGRLSMTTMLGIYSLQWSTLGQCLYTTSFEQNAVSVSLSPVSRHLLVGLAARRVGPVPPEGHIMAQIYRLDPSVDPTGQGPARGRLWHLRDLEQGPDQPFVSLNCIRWAPRAGQGLVYGTNNGQLRVLR